MNVCLIRLAIVLVSIAAWCAIVFMLAGKTD